MSRSDYRMDIVTRLVLGGLFMLEIVWIAISAVIQIFHPAAEPLPFYGFQAVILAAYVSVHVAVYRDYLARRRADSEKNPLAHMKY